MPDLALVVPALAALIVILAWSLVFSRTLAALRPHVPGIFQPLIDALASADNAIYNALRGWADPASQPFSEAINSVVAALQQLVQNPGAFARSVSASLTRLFTVTIPDAISTAEDYAAAGLTDLKAATEADLRALDGNLAGLFGQVAALGQLIAQAYAQATAYALDLGRQAEAFAGSLFSQAETDLKAVEAQAAASLVEVETELVNEIDQVAVSAAQEIAAAEQAAINYADQVAVNAAQEVAAARADFAAALTISEEQVSQAIDSVLKSAPWAGLVAALGVGEAVIKSDVQTLVNAGLEELRKTLGDAESIRARLGPEIAKFIPKAGG